ncbi:MAG: hypothetical protein IIA45_12980 [Bacteroidetes bacterium]|nr:hypothetical protein [Bacteroidota bacterium]
MEAIFIKDGSKVKNKGEYSRFDRSDGSKGLIYCCPQCGEVSGGTDKHKFNDEGDSVTPSIIHKCGWHGYLENNVFVGE